MVFVLNGEVLPDSDPRAIAARGKGAAGPTQRHPASGAPASAHARSDAPQHAARAPQAGPTNPVAGLLLKAATAIGIQDKSVRVPAIAPLSLPATELPLIYIIVVGILFLFLGWPALLIAALAYVLLNSPSGPAAAAAPAAAARPAAPTGRPAAPAPAPKRGVHSLLD